MAPTKKKPLKQLLVERGLAETPERAEALVLAGKVRVGGLVAKSAGSPVPLEAPVEVEPLSRFVSRSAEKLEGALLGWGLVVDGLVCADVGSSTGGFTQVLLASGAAKVFAIDVGANELAWKLRNDPRVVVMERTNARSLNTLPEPISFCSIDVSFISLAKILPQTLLWFGPSGGVAAALIKPQFEARRDQVPEGGIVRDVAVHREVLEQICSVATELGYAVRGLRPAWPRGSGGNQEFFVWLEYLRGPPVELKAIIDETLRAAQLNNLK